MGEAKLLQTTLVDEGFSKPKDLVFLLASGYDGSSYKAYLKLYDASNREVKIVYDETGHRPYCYVKQSPEDLKNVPELNRPDIVGFLVEKKLDLLSDKYIKVTKILAKDPLTIGGRKDSVREIVTCWEADIPYHLNYLYDTGLIPGMPYVMKDGRLEIVLADKDRVDRIIEYYFKGYSKGEELEELRKWLSVLEADQPDLDYLAMDIEVSSPVATRIPDPDKARDRVVAIALASSDGLRKVMVLKNEGSIVGDVKSVTNDGYELVVFDTSKERDMLEQAFRIMENYPIIASFNGDSFDLPYLRHRGENLGIPKDSIPITLGKDGASLRRGVHIDLYRFFLNKSIQIYAFENKYREHTLEAISQAILGKGKRALYKSIEEMSLRELADYVYGDAKLVYDLLSFNDKLVMRLLIVLSRISRMSMEEVCRHGVSGWIKNLLYFEHRRKGYLIPRPDDIISKKGEVHTKAIIKGKKYRGAIVYNPLPGIHFNVVVLDFGSLYPSVLKVWNLGYETIRCPHEDGPCKSNKVPETDHWVCRKRTALQSLLIGSLRDIRVKWYKPKSNDKGLPQNQKGWYDVVQRALKVILNAAYGVFGFEEFPFYCPPVAEATAAIGRYAFKQAVEKARSLGIQLVYGDTDSLFLKTHDKDKINEMVSWASEELGLDLEFDKFYRYVVFSTRKKNYLGVTDASVVDIKGLTGKKRHTPNFIKEAFETVLEKLKSVSTEEDLEHAKKTIGDVLSSWYHRLKKGDFKLEELAFHVMMSRGLERYEKTTPQHVKAAKKLEAMGRKVGAGDIISFVKTKTKDGVEPLEYADKSKVDVDKYIEYMRSAFEQILDALEIDFENIIGKRSLEDFF